MAEAPDPTAAASVAEFVDALRELRRWAGQPSLRRMCQLAGTTVDTAGRTIVALPKSTVSEVLRTGRLPRMEFVRAFVTACLLARQRPAREIAERLERWHTAWLQLPAAEPDLRGTRVPRQLPADDPAFTGRAGELAELRTLLSTARAGRTTAPVIAVLHGVAAAGKSVLAIHVAHRVAAAFPDGQLYVDLRGQSAEALEPGEVLGRFLRALGTDSAEIPAQADESAALLRTRLAGRAMLLVLDNAEDEAQVLPLLPGTPGCAVLVTSRRILPGLPGARHLRLGPISRLPDVELLLERLVAAGFLVVLPPVATGWPGHRHSASLVR